MQETGIRERISIRVYQRSAIFIVRFPYHSQKIFLLGTMILKIASDIPLRPFIHGQFVDTINKERLTLHSAVDESLVTDGI
jgi:hypothetical protein